MKKSVFYCAAMLLIGLFGREHAQAALIVTDNNAHQVLVDGVPLVSQPGADEPLDVTSYNGFIYFVNDQDGSIRSADPFGNVAILQSGLNQPYGIAVDALRNRIVFTETGAGNVRSMDLDGSNLTILFSGLNSPLDVTYHPLNDQLYVTDDVDNLIVRGPAIGGTMTTVLAVDEPLGLALDTEFGHIFFTNPAQDLLQRVDEDGSNLVTILSGFDLLRGIDINSITGQLAFISDNDVWGVNRDGTGLDILLTLNEPVGVRFDNSFFIPEPSSATLLGVPITFFLLLRLKRAHKAV